MISIFKRTLAKLACTLFLLAATSSVFAVSSFKIQNVVVHGNQRLSSGTVFSYLQVHPGQQYTNATGDAIIKTLFKTGFFKDVNLSREGHTLIVTVSERPTIGYLSITGNKAIKTKQLYKVLKRIDLVEGGVYDPTKLNQIRLGLENEYSRLGHYVAIVNTYVKPAPHNQVSLHIQVTEGPIAKVHSIKFSGNQHFSQRQLRDTFTLTTSGIFTIFNHHDRYSENQLDTDLLALKNYYYDHGYLKFKVLSKNIKFNPTHTKVTIHVTINEGPVYRISGFKIAEHDKYLHKIESMIDLKKGDIFSRSNVIAINKNIANFFADRGYAFPSVEPLPVLNDRNDTVFINYHVSIGERIYVRDINIAGNTRTNGRVIRARMRQMEDALYSRGRINESKRMIASPMPYLNNVTATPAPVAGHPDQVDLDYHVKETNAGKASIQGGYSDLEGFIYGASLTEPNFMGSGRFVSVGFTRSKYSANYNLAYNNPFYTIDGVSRGFNIFYSHTTPGKVNLESYTMDDFGANFSYGIPISEFNAFNLGAGYDYIDISDVNRASVSPAVTNFLDKHKPGYNQFNLNGGFIHQSLDRAIFPTNGSLQQLHLTVGPPIGKISLGYYTATYNAKWYLQFGHSGFVLEPHAILGYGGGLGSGSSLPFFNNFYGGGISTLPGFEPNSLGPKNPNDTTQAMGGNLEVFAGANLFAPTFFSDRVRVGATFNVGNVFDTHQLTTTPKINYENVGNIENYRMSAGVLVSWWWPLGAPIDISLAFPLNKKKNDQEAIFGFSMGGSL